MDWLTLAGLTAAVFGAASTGALFSPGRWYDTLDKPVWTPPNWLFPVAWTFLYAAMVWAAYRVSGDDADLATPALAFWTAQIVFNALWSPVFFGLHRIGSALIVLICLWVCVVATTILFFRIDVLAGALFVPYVIWVSYAGALNAAILRSNRSRQISEPAS
ncbi:MAG: TspO/MBR family protein [Pseudomonadota bacterium]